MGACWNNDVYYTLPRALQCRPCTRWEEAHALIKATGWYQLSNTLSYSNCIACKFRACFYLCSMRLHQEASHPTSGALPSIQ